jgi:hypothetical protein
MCASRNSLLLVPFSVTEKGVSESKMTERGVSESKMTEKGVSKRSIEAKLNKGPYKRSIEAKLKKRRSSNNKKEHRKTSPTGPLPKHPVLHLVLANGILNPVGNKRGTDRLWATRKVQN